MRRRLAGARRADEHAHLAGRHGQRQVADRRARAGPGIACSRFAARAQPPARTPTAPRYGRCLQIFTGTSRTGAPILAHRSRHLSGRRVASLELPDAGRVAQLARAPRLHRGGRPFESGRAHCRSASTDSPPMTDDAPIRIAVIGSGPAGFYAAGHLLKDARAASRSTCSSACPRRGGSCARAWPPTTRRSSRSPASTRRPPPTPAFATSATSSFGEHVSREDLLRPLPRDRVRHRLAVRPAAGDPRRRPAGGSHAATEFVGWYNGHPDHTRPGVRPSLRERAVVIGNGNVALDVARMLVLAPEELAPTDTADHALEVLAHSSVREVVDRRPARPRAGRLHQPRAAGARRAGRRRRDRRRRGARARARRPRPEAPSDTTRRRNVEILREYAARPPAGHAKRDRPALPALARRVPARRARAVSAPCELVRNDLVATPDGALRARPPDERETIPAGLVFRAIGYRGRPAPGRPLRRAPGGDPQRGRTRDRPRRRARCRASTRSAGSSAAPPA